MPTAAELRERMAADRQRYAAAHKQDEPLDEPETIARHVMLPRYLEERTAPIPDGPTRKERWQRDVAGCIANRDRGPLRPGDRGKLSTET